MLEFFHAFEQNPFLGTLVGNSLIAFGLVIIVLFSSFLVKKLQKALDFITAITVGLLLGIVFLGFFPELVESGVNAELLGISILLGILLFYVFELFFHWHHCKDLGHGHHHSEHNHSSGKLMLVGTFFHNAFHGIEIFAAFAVDFRFGILVSIAILLHSIPQNIANYIMNHQNIKVVLVAAVAGVFGSLLTYPFYQLLIENKFFVLGIIAGGLLYTSLADIFPSFKSKGTGKNKLIYLLFVIFGTLLFSVFNELTHSHSHEMHENEIHTDSDNH